MQKTETMPWWVFLAFSSIETRKGAMILIWLSFIFSVYCIPWGNYIDPSLGINQLFLIDDWSWAMMMFPMVVWYWLSMKWIDNNYSWAEN